MSNDIELSRQEKCILKKLYKAYPGGLCCECQSTILERFGRKGLVTIVPYKNGMAACLTDDGINLALKMKRQALWKKIVLGILTLILIPLIVNCLSALISSSFASALLAPAANP